MTTEPGKKFDAGKAPVSQGLFDYFPRALLAVAEISQFGFEKYKTWGGWRSVPDGENRYENACGRHTLWRRIEGIFDRESRLRHRAHRAWNALATLELELEAAENALLESNQALDIAAEELKP